jgi:uncharacterized protein (TIGR02600 family)
MGSSRLFLQHVRESRRGIALISVLAMVMLLTALIVAFMMRAGSERQAAGFYRAEATTRELSDTTLNLVEGLINEGTNQTSATAGVYYSWASQPGSIRVFDNVNGAPYKVFKLYSSPAMSWSSAAPPAATPTVATFLSADLPTSTPLWYTMPGVWVDLNAPVNTDPSGLRGPSYTHFPILDPRDPTANPPTDVVTTKMDGFSITGAPQDTTKIDSTNAVNPAPMPVHWLYVLQDGTLTTPDPTATQPNASGNYTFPAASAPSLNNPIVGRVAFWTDDETCKVNVNTAGADGLIKPTTGSSAVSSPGDRADPSAPAQGTFWSPPYFAGADDWGPTTTPGAPGSGPFLAGLADAQPMSGEYQRYPGHPSTVALSNILNSLGATVNTSNFYSADTTHPGITPRYLYGGTQENTLLTYGAAGYHQYGTELPVVPTADFRLYPTLSELLFPPNRNPTPTTSFPLNTQDAAARQRMESGRFFLTTHSRAPELNLFGLPRVSIWPLSSTVGNRTAVDNLLAFCTTIGGNLSGSAYYFTRAKSYDSTADISLTDANGKQRNILLLKYLDYLTSQNIPGFSKDPTATGKASFATKDYSGNKSSLAGQNDQILTEIFDYIRTTNIMDATSPAPYDLGPGGAANGGYGAVWQGSSFGNNQVVPTLATPAIMGNSWGGVKWSGNHTTEGNANFPRLVEVSLQLVAMGQGGSSAANFGTPVNPSEMLFSPSLLGPGDTVITTFYNHPLVNGTAGNATNPYDAPGALHGPPVAATNKVSAVANFNVMSASTDPAAANLRSGIPPNGTTAVQAFLLLNFLNPAESWMYCASYVWVSVSGLSSFKLGNPTAYSLGFPDPDCMVFGVDARTYHGGGHSGYPTAYGNTWYKWLKPSSASTNSLPHFYFPFYSKIIPILGTRTGLVCGPLTIKIYDAPNGTGAEPAADATGAPAGAHLLQTYTVTFPAGPTSVPLPTVPINTPFASSYPTSASLASPVTGWAFPGPNPYYGPNPLYAPWITNIICYGTWVNNVPAAAGPGWPNWEGYPAWLVTAAAGYSCTVKATEKTGPVIGVSEVGSPVPGNLNDPVHNRWAQYGAMVDAAGEEMFGPGDVVQSMVPAQTWSDPRIMLSATVGAVAWTKHPNFGRQWAHNFYGDQWDPWVGNGGLDRGGGAPDPNAPAGGYWAPCSEGSSVGSLAGNQANGHGGPVCAWAPCNSGTAVSTSTGANSVPAAPANTSWPAVAACNENHPPNTLSGAPPDWDNGTGIMSDGPWINKADEGSSPDQGTCYTGNPSAQGSAEFSANRQVSSPGMFGSLPTGADPAGLNPASWQTLLFRPGIDAARRLMAANGVVAKAGFPALPASPATGAHPGEGIPVSATSYTPPYTSPPDHLWLDLFWIPVAEPYALSEPMSTAGKINLNYQIVPFTYIKRQTALRAALATEKIAQVSSNQANAYRGLEGLTVDGTSKPYPDNLSVIVNSHYPIDLDLTLSQFESKFANWDVFRSASQICEEFLVPMDIPNTLLYGTAATSHADASDDFLDADSMGNYPLPATPVTSATLLTGVAKFAADWYTPISQATTAASPAPFAMVGDNVREQPYAHMYGKITTKSNTFTVYYRVQALKSPPSVGATVWNEAQGAVTGEYRGSTTLERFIDPNEGTTTAGVFTPSVPDAVTAVSNGTVPTSLEKYYKWRVVENHQFAP